LTYVLRRCTGKGSIGAVSRYRLLRLIRKDMCQGVYTSDKRRVPMLKYEHRYGIARTSTERHGFIRTQERSCQYQGLIKVKTTKICFKYRKELCFILYPFWQRALDSFQTKMICSILASWAWCKILKFSSPKINTCKDPSPYCPIRLLGAMILANLNLHYVKKH
jgi:hypothetical protein